MARQQRKSGKRYSQSARREREGVALINQIVTAMGHIWREKGVDHGIDGEIELVDEGNATNRVLWVQSKAQGDSNPFPAENDSGFHYRCSIDDLEYWRTGTAPVLLICSHPESGDAWFKDLEGWFKDPANSGERNIPFDKVADRFEPDVGRKLLKLGADTRSGLYLRPAPRHETLTTNLLAVGHLASSVTVAPTSCRGWADANPRLIRAGQPTVSDIVFTGGQLLSLRAPSDPVITALADGVVRQVATDTFSVDDVYGPSMPWLLNATLKDLTHRDLRFDPDRKYLYFKPNVNGSDRKVSSGRNRHRTVVVHKRPPEGATWVAYHRHYALQSQFIRLDGQWLLSLVPTYHFSSDGRTESPFAGVLLKGIKQLDHHDAVRSQTAFWAHYLAWTPSLFNGQGDDRLRFGRLVTSTVERGIDDRSWKPAPPEFTQSNGDLEMTLFDTGAS